MFITLISKKDTAKTVPRSPTDPDLDPQITERKLSTESCAQSKDAYIPRQDSSQHFDPRLDAGLELELGFRVRGRVRERVRERVRVRVRIRITVRVRRLVTDNYC